MADMYAEWLGSDESLNTRSGRGRRGVLTPMKREKSGGVMGSSTVSCCMRAWFRSVIRHWRQDKIVQEGSL